MPRWRWPLHTDSHKRKCCCTRIVAANIAFMTTRHCCGGIASRLVIRDGETWDNVAMESFFRSLKAERVYLTRYASY